MCRKRRFELLCICTKVQIAARATVDFRIVSIELVNGKTKVVREAKMNRWTGAEIQAVLKGAETLGGPWEDVLADGGSPHHAVLQGGGRGAVGGGGRGATALPVRSRGSA